MLQLSDSTTLFVSTETSTGYQHTAGLMLLDATESPDFCFEKFKAFIDERMGSIPQFRWKLREVPFGLDLPYWVEDESYSIERHVHRVVQQQILLGCVARGASWLLGHWRLAPFHGAQHAFHNDTAGARYDKAAAELAWSRTVVFLKRELG